ncbi:MAG TPA: hypothetical protein VK131_02420 [Candidatus Acidoferrales bacterium]|nr:hypothetical protein [Candidatus Acidoferrales bacterium]
MLATLIAANAFPAPDLSASNIGDFVREHRDAMRWGGYLGALATVPLLLFANGLRILLTNAGSGGLGTMALTGGAVSAGVLLVAGALQQVIVVYPTSDPEVAAVLGRLGPSELSAAVIGFPFALMMASVAIAAIKSGVLPWWYGWLALILAVLKSLDPLHLALASPKTGTPAFLATILWLLLTVPCSWVHEAHPKAQLPPAEVGPRPRRVLDPFGEVS